MRYALVVLVTGMAAYAWSRAVTAAVTAWRTIRAPRNRRLAWLADCQSTHDSQNAAAERSADQ